MELTMACGIPLVSELFERWSGNLLLGCLAHGRVQGKKAIHFKACIIR